MHNYIITKLQGDLMTIDDQITVKTNREIKLQFKHFCELQGFTMQYVLTKFMKLYVKNKLHANKLHHYFKED